MMRSTLLILGIAFLSYAGLDTIPEVYGTPEDFVNDSSIILDSTFRLSEIEDSKDPEDPDYAIIYTNSRGKRRYYNEKVFAIRVGEKYYVRDKSDLFGPACFRPITRCNIASYYSLVTTSMYNHSGKKGEVAKTWYMIYMKENGIIQPLTTPRVRELVIRKHPLLYNEFASKGPHSVESLLSYLDAICH